VNARLVEVRGELFVTLETAAECYGVELCWIERVYAEGLLGPGERVGPSLAFPAAELDRLAAVLRWQHLGLDLDTVSALLSPYGER
jgi:GAF domain-containing protein